jgi:LemA protein
VQTRTDAKRYDVVEIYALIGADAEEAMGTWIAGGAALLLLLYLVWTYNHLITLRNRVRNGWSQIDVQLRRRHELIPNLVESVKGYMAHESGIIDTIARARQQAIAAGGNIEARASAEATLDRSLRSFIVQAEAIPQLRASENMMALQEELTSSENRIAFARQYYNDSVMQYNTAITTVPANLFATPLGFTPEVLFAADAADRQPVTVRF